MQARFRANDNVIPAMDDYWSVACLLLHARDAFHHIQKANSVEGNGTLRPVSEVEMVNTANFTTLLNKKICYLNEMLYFRL